MDFLEDVIYALCMLFSECIQLIVTFFIAYKIQRFDLMVFLMLVWNVGLVVVIKGWMQWVEIER